MHRGKGNPGRETCGTHKALFIPAAPGREGANRTGWGTSGIVRWEPSGTESGGIPQVSMRGREPSFPPRNPIRQPAHFLPTSGLPSSQQAPPSSLVSFPLPRQLRQKDRREARREGAKTTRGREARQCQTWWGEKDGLWIAAAVAGGELQKATGQGGSKDPFEGLEAKADLA